MRGIELTGGSRVRVDLHEEQFSAQLIEIEVKRFAPVAVGADEAAHEATGTDGNTEVFEFTGLGGPGRRRIKEPQNQANS